MERSFFRRVLSAALSFLLMFAVLPTGTFVFRTNAADTPVNIGPVAAAKRTQELIDGLKGRYFTTTQEKWKNDSGDACFNVNVIQTDWLKNTMGLVPDSPDLMPEHYHNVKKGGLYARAWSCGGFANYCLWYIYAQKASDKVEACLIYGGTFTKSDLDKSGVRKGDVIRVNGWHSFVYISHDDSGVCVLDSNFNHDNRVDVHWIFWRDNGHCSDEMGVTRGKNWTDSEAPSPGVSAGQSQASADERGAYKTDMEQTSTSPEQRTISGERDIVLCLDMSGSMSGDKLQQTKEASVKFINAVLQENAGIAIVTYNDSARALTDFSVNARDLIPKVNEISDGGGTNIEDGLAKSYNLLNCSNAKKQIIVLMSDGEPNHGKVGEELITYADSIKKEGIYIYTLGFFGGYSGRSAAQTLMERLASDGCHYEVSDADSLVFFFGDIADTINGQEYIYIRIACPVDVKASYNGETLSSDKKKLNTRTSFGSLTFEENTSEYSGDDVDNRIKTLRLKADVDYDIQIKGNGRGWMNYTIGFMDESGEYSDFRKFNNIKVRKSTVIDTVAAKSKATVLDIDEDGDGKYDLKYKAGANECGEKVDYSFIFYISAAAGGIIAVLTAFLAIKSKLKKRKVGK